jgi:PAS domain S-box-containing protein
MKRAGFMRSQVNPRVAEKLHEIAWVGGLFVMLIAVLSLAGWTLRLPFLLSPVPSSSAMVPNTACLFLMGGAALCILQKGMAGRMAGGLARGFAVVMILGGTLTIWEYLSGRDSGIDTILFKETVATLETPNLNTLHPGRPSILTAINFVLLGLSLFFMEPRESRASRPSEVPAFLAMQISFLALIGYVCDVPLLYGWATLVPGPGMALGTLIAFLVLGMGLLCARPREGLLEIVTSSSGGGIMARRIIFTPVLIPLLIGFLKWGGERMGIYNQEVAPWLFAFLNILVFTVVVWWVARLLHRAELVRDMAQKRVQKLNLELEERVRDRTAELSRVLQQLKEGEERVRLVVDTALDAVVTIDEAGLITSWNREAERTFGWRGGEILGKPLAETIIPPRYREAHERGMKHFVASREGPVLNRRIEITALRRSGEEFPVELAITPIQTGGRFIFSAFLREITERKRADDEIRKLNASLEQRVQHRTAELEAANRELEAFSYSVSHDLRAPLRHIDGFLDLLRRDTASNLSESGSRYLDVISRAAVQMGTLIEDLLAFSRTGRAEMRRARVETGGLVDEVITEMAHDLKGRSIRWDIGPLPDVEGDRAMLKQVWTNLIANAVKYTRTRDLAEIIIRGDDGNGRAEFSIRDNGVGFDMQYAGKLFGVFQRLHRPEEFEGTGIGLANAQRIMLRHGGTIRAESELDRGSVFSFVLPGSGRNHHEKPKNDPAG